MIELLDIELPFSALKFWAPALMTLLVLLVAIPAAASATTFCVHQAGSCPSGQTDEGADLQQALDDAGNHAGSDSVQIGPGTFAHDAGFNYVYNSNIAITGAGAGQTILESSAAHPAPGYVFQFSGDSTSVLSGITIHVQSGDGGGLLLNASTASGISVTTDPAPIAGQEAVSPQGGATLEHSVIQNNIGDTCCAAAIYANGTGDVTLVDDTLIGFYGLAVFDSNADVTARDIHVIARVGVVADEGDATIDGMLAILSPLANQPGLTSAQGSKLTVRSATVIGKNADAGSHGLQVYGDGAVSRLNLQDSIVRGFPVGWQRLPDGSGSISGLTLENDDIAAIGDDQASSGPPTVSDNIDVDPSFVDANTGDYHLRFGSPAIDSGGDCQSICTSVPDLDGLTRPIDGNGDGQAIRDMGAYEYGRRAPSVKVSASNSQPLAGEPIAFTAVASDPDPGDTVTLSWSFDDGSTATGTSVAHAFANAGTHTVTVTATDSSGLETTASTPIQVTAKQVIPAHKPNTKITKSSFSSRRKMAVLRFRALGAASRFQCRLLRRHARKKAKFRVCKSPRSYRHLKPGRYTFMVRAVNSAGADPTPAKKAFRIRH